MTSRTSKRLKRAAAIVGILYLAGGLALYLLQEQLLFHPSRIKISSPYRFDQQFEEINFNGVNNINILHFTPKQESKGTIIFYHGNMENNLHYKRYATVLCSLGFDVWMPDYPQFGKSRGRLDEESLLGAALLAYDEVEKRAPASRIIIYGKSIGTGVAAYVAANRKSERLILETPYYSITDLARHYVPFYPAKSLLRWKLTTSEYLSHVTTDVTLFHGTRDEVVPYSQSLKLIKNHPRSQLITINDGHHNDLLNFPVFVSRLDSVLCH